MTASPSTSPCQRVDVIVDSYNYERFLRAAIDSALAQTHPHVRVTVVDDGSTDGSRQIIESYGDRVRAVLKDNGGQASAFNAGFAATDGDVVIFLDADDVLRPTVAAQVVAAAAAQPDVAKVQYRLEVIDAAGVATGAVKPHAHLPLPSGDLRREELLQPFDLTWMSTSGNAFPRWVLQRLLPIPEAEFARCADWYLQHLPPLLGAVVTLDSIGGGYRVHGGNSYELADTQLDLEHVRSSVAYAAATTRQIVRVADEIGIDRPREVLSVADLANRITSRRLAPERHPIPGDRVPKLVLSGWRATARRVDVGLTMRLLFVAWFGAMAVAPRPAARQLAAMFLFPERRTRLNGLLGRLHARHRTSS